MEATTIPLVVPRSSRDASRRAAVPGCRTARSTTRNPAMPAYPARNQRGRARTGPRWTGRLEGCIVAARPRPPRTWKIGTTSLRLPGSGPGRDSRPTGLSLRSRGAVPGTRPRLDVAGRGWGPVFMQARSGPKTSVAYASSEVFRAAKSWTIDRVRPSTGSRPKAEGPDGSSGCGRRGTPGTDCDHRPPHRLPTDVAVRRTRSPTRAAATRGAATRAAATRGGRRRCRDARPTAGADEQSQPHGADGPLGRSGPARDARTVLVSRHAWSGVLRGRLARERNGSMDL